MCPILELIQTLKECLFCEIYCAQLCAHMRSIVTASCTVSSRESRYPPSTPAGTSASDTLPPKTHKHPGDGGCWRSTAKWQGGHSRLHLFLPDQEFSLQAVVPAHGHHSDKNLVEASSCKHSKFKKGTLLTVCWHASAASWYNSTRAETQTLSHRTRETGSGPSLMDKLNLPFFNVDKLNPLSFFLSFVNFEYPP